MKINVLLSVYNNIIGTSAEYGHSDFGISGHGTT